MSISYDIQNVSKHIIFEKNSIPILTPLSFSVYKGESIAILGMSGSGKSSLLHILGTLDPPTSGTVLFEGQNLYELSNEAISHIRSKEISFIFQFYHLLPEFTTLENILLRASLANLPPKEAKERALTLLDDVGLFNRKDHSVTTLSGGEKQRASIARALIVEPRVLLADEPTGSLDLASGHTITNILLSLNEKYQTTLILVTHNTSLAKEMGRAITLERGERDV
ncbi:MAG: ABC transporter ATP-binding protein [Desulfovibrionaceae bacterium]